MLDLARNFLSVHQIRKTIDTMGAPEDERLAPAPLGRPGWRIEITNEGRDPGDDIDYIRLTAVSGQTAIESGGPQRCRGPQVS